MASLISRLFKTSDYRREHELALQEAKVAEMRKDYEFIERVGRLPIHKFSDYQSYITAGCQKVWASFRAVHITASVLLKTQFIIVSPGTKDPVIPPDLSRLLRNPNPYDSWEEMIYLWTHHMKFTGNCYWVKDQMNGRGQPLYLYPLLPQFVEVIPDPVTKVSKYIYRVQGRSITFLPNEIIHFKRPNPNDLVMGIGDVEPAQALFSDQINRDLYNERFMENGASPSGVLVREEAMEDQTEWQKFKNWWDKTYSGKKNAGKTAFLNGKWKYTQLGLSSSDMQAIEKEKMSIQQIFIAHGVPLSVAGIEKAANLATARQDDINFRKNECVPLIDILVGKLNSESGFIKAFNPNFLLDYNLSGLIDVEQVMKDYQPMVELGAMTLNELRSMAGLQRTDNPLHDQFYIKAGLTPLEMAGLATPTEEELEKIVGGLTRAKK